MVTRINASLATAQYQPGQVPTDTAQLPRYLSEEFQKISAMIDLLQAGHKDVTYAAPKKPRTGDIRYADGTSWNPGSGEGIYRYSIAGTWAFLG